MKGLPRILFALLALVLAAAFVYSRLSSRSSFSGTVIEAMPQAPDLTLEGSDGGQHKLSDWNGKVRLVFFAYTHCPDTCPLTLAALARQYEALGEPADLQIIMITVDPRRDTPARLKEYLARFHRSFVGLTGTPEQIARVSSAFYAGYGSGLGKVVQHSDEVRVLDKAGRLRAVYNQEKLAREDLYHDLPQILRWP